MKSPILSVTNLEHLILLNPIKIDSEKFTPISKIQGIILERIGFREYQIENFNKVIIPKKGAYTLVYRLHGNNETIPAAIKFYEKA